MLQAIPNQAGTFNRQVGLTQAEEGAMELALIRPDLVTQQQVLILAQALKNKTSLVGLSGIAQSNAAAAAQQTNAAQLAQRTGHAGSAAS